MTNKKFLFPLIAAAIAVLATALFLLKSNPVLSPDASGDDGKKQQTVAPTVTAYDEAAKKILTRLVGESGSAPTEQALRAHQSFLALTVPAERQAFHLEIVLLLAALAEEEKLDETSLEERVGAVLDDYPDA